MPRAKVYRLNAEGSWDDAGTGQASLELLDSGCRGSGGGGGEGGSPRLVVVSEENAGQRLLEHAVRRDVRYQRQGEDTIISWVEPDTGAETALSFQDALGCDAVWSELRALRGEGLAGNRAAGGPARRGCVDEFESAGGGGVDEAPGPAVELPSPALDNLEEIGRVLAGLHPCQREGVSTQLLRGDYIPRLLELFHRCEDLENREALAAVHRVVRGIITLTDANVLEELLKEQFVMDVVGALEYDPEVPVHVRHRDFLRDRAIFKEVVPIADPSVRAKIHQTYRIQYVKDVVLPRVLDDQAFATMTSIVVLNTMDVVCSLGRDANFLPELFRRLKGGDGLAAAGEQTRDMVSFLQEFCGLLKHLQPSVRQQLYAELVDLGLYDVLTRVFREGNTAVRLKAADILFSAIQHDGTSLRCFLAGQTDQEMLSLLIKELIEGQDEGLCEQILDVLKYLLDPEMMDGSQDRKIIDAFYEKYMSCLVEALAKECPGAAPHERKVPATTKGIILELLGFCVQHHTYNIKYYILRNNVLEKVLALLKMPEKWLVVAALRFVRICVAMKDDFYNRYLIRNNLFEPVVDLFLANGRRYNLLNSTVIELVDFIRREGIKSLVVHLVDKFYPRLEGVAYVETFKQLKEKYDHFLEGGVGLQGSTAREGSSPVAPHRRDVRDMEREEEAHFGDEGNNGENTAPPPTNATSINRNGCLEPNLIGTPASGSVVRLVDYDDDEDNENQVETGTNTDGSSDQAAAESDLLSSQIQPPVKRQTETNPPVQSLKRSKIVHEQLNGG